MGSALVVQALQNQVMPPLPGIILDDIGNSCAVQASLCRGRSTVAISVNPAIHYQFYQRPDHAPFLKKNRQGIYDTGSMQNSPSLLQYECAATGHHQYPGQYHLPMGQCCGPGPHEESRRHYKHRQGQ